MVESVESIFQDEMEEMVKMVSDRIEIISEKSEEVSADFSNDFSSDEILKAIKANEVGDAKLFIDLYRDQFVFDRASVVWYKWGGQYWVEDRMNDVTVAMDGVVNLYQEEYVAQARSKVQGVKEEDKDKVKASGKVQGQLIKRIRELQSVARINSVLKLAGSGSESLAVSGEQWDLNPWVFGCANGVIDLKTGQLREGTPEDFIKTVCPTELADVNEPAPQWEQFLDEIFDGNQDLIRFVQRVLGYSITGLRQEHVFLVMWGQGRNGKGTLLETLKHVLGPLADPIPAATLLNSRNRSSGAAASPDIMKLRGKRLVWASETGEGNRLNDDKIKWLTGGDTMTGRELYARHLVTFRPSHTLFLLTNHKPSVAADEYALWKRISLIPFELSFVDDPTLRNERKRDPELLSKLKSEASGILAWLVRGCLEWQKMGLDPPDVVKAATDEYRSEEDILGHFIDDSDPIPPGHRVKASELYAKYKKWCDDNGHMALSSTKFGRKMGDRFTKDRDRTGTYYLGKVYTCDECDGF